MNHYPIPGARTKLHTNATRRYLVVSVFDGRPKVEASSDEQADAARLLENYRRRFILSNRCSVQLFDQGMAYTRADEPIEMAAWRDGARR